VIVAAGGSVGHVEVVELEEIEAAVGVGRAVADGVRMEGQELLVGGYDTAVYQLQR
jgi:hypothetical protein